MNKNLQEIKKEFNRLNEEIGWDASIDFLQQFCENVEIKLLCDIYWKGYKVLKNNDVDDGLCFEIRQFAIQTIRNTMEGWL